MSEMTTPPYMAPHIGQGATTTRFSATEWLTSLGYVVRRGGDSGALRLTPEGWAYWERLRLGPTRYWIKNNWFPALVALGTFITSVAAIVTAIVTLIWRGA